jgi:hypothetical protein
LSQLKSRIGIFGRSGDWQMKINDPRTKLKSVYPTIKL